MMDFDYYRTNTTPYRSSADTSDEHVRSVCLITSQNPSFTITCRCTSDCVKSIIISGTIEQLMKKRSMVD